jgi:hypothetical protein
VDEGAAAAAGEVLAKVAVCPERSVAAAIHV